MYSDNDEFVNNIEEDEEDNDAIYSLLDKFSESRASIQKMIDEIEEITTTVKQLFPDNFDVRYRLVFQERVKAVTELFKTLLDMRKEITKNIKDEIEIRRKVKSKNSLGNIEEMLNMNSIMEKIEDFQNNKMTKAKKIDKKMTKSIKDITEEDLQNEIQKAEKLKK